MMWKVEIGGENVDCGEKPLCSPRYGLNIYTYELSCYVIAMIQMHCCKCIYCFLLLMLILYFCFGCFSKIIVCTFL